MFEIKWKDKTYRFDENVTNAIFETVKSKDLSESEKMVIAMSVEPKITIESINQLPKLLLVRINKKITEFVNMDF